GGEACDRAVGRGRALVALDRVRDWDRRLRIGRVERVRPVPTRGVRVTRVIPLASDEMQAVVLENAGFVDRVRALSTGAVADGNVALARVGPVVPRVQQTGASTNERIRIAEAGSEDLHRTRRRDLGLVL